MARTLDAEASRRILEATVELLLERGYSALTFDAVAERAAVSRPALYRRHTGKRDLCLAAIRSLLPPLEPPPGDDHEARARALFTVQAKSPLDRYVALVGELIALEPAEPELIAAWRDHVLEPRRQIVLNILRAAAAEGVLRADPEFVMDSLTGHLLARVWRGAPFDEDWIDRTWTAVWTAATHGGYRLTD